MAIEVPIFSALARKAAMRRTDRREAARQQLDKAAATAKAQRLNGSAGGGWPTTPGYDHSASKWPF